MTQCTAIVDGIQLQDVQSTFVANALRSCNPQSLKDCACRECRKVKRLVRES